MMMATAAGLLCGGVLGARFRVFAIVPAHAGALLVFGAIAVAGGRPVGRLLLEMLAWSLACHGGYLAAALLKPFRPSPGRPADSVRRALF